MAGERIHRFELGGKRFAIDPETCFCFECDGISWDVLEYYPDASVTRIIRLLGEQHDPKELSEVVGELEWLRTTKSILVQPAPEDFVKTFSVERGVKHLAVSLPGEDAVEAPRKRGWFGKDVQVVSNSAREQGREAVELLLTRSEQQKELAIEFIVPGAVRQPELLAGLCAHALRLASLAGKKLSAVVHVADIALTNPPEALKGHTVSAKLAFQDPSGIAPHLNALAKGGTESLARLVKVLQPGAEGVSGRIVVRPNHPEYGGVVPELDKAGFKVIEIDLDGAFIANPALEPAAMLPGLSQSAVYYAEQLAKGRHFRLDPIAALFYRIHEGKPQARTDATGTNELAVDADGGIYPSWRFFGMPEFRAGSIVDGHVDEEALKRYDDVGSLTTSACRNCWARNLCGGGTAAVHQALSGSFRKPHGPWCDAQRMWMASAVSAFNILSGQGVNFTPIYQGMNASSKPSLFSLATMARAALQLNVLMRPIAEADAEMLVKWENWSEASYFVLHPGCVLMTTQYEREMDALHPQVFVQEMVATLRGGAPIGLVRMTPDMAPGAMRASIFLHDEALYAQERIRKGFRFLLTEAGKQQSLRRILVEAADREPALQAFLEALGFKKAGAQREALFLHNAWHSVSTFVLALD